MRHQRTERGGIPGIPGIPIPIPGMPIIGLGIIPPIMGGGMPGIIIPGIIIPGMPGMAPPCFAMKLQIQAIKEGTGIL
jgi:hypothetical protein